MKDLDLKNNAITVGELLDHPASRAVLAKKFPLVVKKPLTGAARTVTLEQLVSFLSPYLPAAVIRDTMNELKKL